MSGDTAEVLEEQLLSLALESGSPLSREDIRSVAGTLAAALTALRQTARTLDAVEEAPAMRPALADEPCAASASAGV